MNERNEFIFCGRVIGTYIGWDGSDNAFVLYDFIPADGIDLPKGEALHIDHESGLVCMYNDQGGIIPETKRDVITVLVNIPRKEPL